MAPTEATILRNYLLLPSRLPSIISLQEFTSLFPKSQQSSPQVRALYRDLQQQRNAVVDAVSASIDAEVKQAKALRRTIIRTKKESEFEEQDDEIEIERTVSRKTLSFLYAASYAPANCNATSYSAPPPLRLRLSNTLFKA
jgi:centromere-localized protein 2